jgi:2-oxoglutarate dehydrogenase E2 component (dihydrolipoamide succinyltransferase)
MPVEIRVPPLGESVVEATVGRWTKKEGEPVSRDEVLVELETDKITVEVAAPQDGVLGRIEKQEGATVGVDELLGALESGDGAARPAAQGPAASARDEQEEAPAPAAGKPEPQTSPAARALAAEHDIDIGAIRGSGPNGRITKEDVQKTIDGRDLAQPTAQQAAGAPRPAEPEPQPAQPSGQPSAQPAAPSAPARQPAPAPIQPQRPAAGQEGRETRERMSRRRQTIARRLVEAQ